MCVVAVVVVWILRGVYIEVWKWQAAVVAYGDCRPKCVKISGFRSVLVEKIVALC